MCFVFFKLFFSLRYRGRPTPAPVGGRQIQEKVEQPEAGGCTHASEEMVKKKDNSNTHTIKYRPVVLDDVRTRILSKRKLCGHSCSSTVRKVAN